MRVITKSGQAGGHDESLEQVKERFEVWRQSRQRGERVPCTLWAAAIDLAQRHGVQRTAQGLRVDCDRLKRHLERRAGSVPAAPLETRFVEMFAAPVPGALSANACIVEMENAQGGKMRISLKGHEALASLTSAFWRAS